MEWINLIKLLPTQINIHRQYNFIKIPERYFEGLDKNNLKISGRIKIHEYLSELKKKKEGIVFLPGIKTCYEEWYLRKSHALQR